LRTTSVILWLVRTLPPTTAAEGEGFKNVFSGTITSIGFRQP